MPYLWVLPNVLTEIEKRHTYTCPTYITSQRWGVLTTTGLSDNFVIEMELPMDPDHEEALWIKRGVAMLTTLDD